MTHLPHELAEADAAARTRLATALVTGRVPEQVAPLRTLRAQLAGAALAVVALATACAWRLLG